MPEDYLYTKQSIMKAVVITSILALAITSCQKTKTEQTTITEKDTVAGTEVPVATVAEKQCFLSVTGKDSIVFEMERKGDSVHGIFNVLPYEKDKRISTFKGVLNGNDGNALGTYSGEGMTNIEELHFKLNGDYVIVDFGPTEQGKDGIWRYKKGEKRYEHIIPKVNCIN